MGLIGSMLNSAAHGAGKIVAIQGIAAASEAIDNASKAVGNVTSSIDKVVTNRRIKRDERYIAASPASTFLYLQFIESGLSADMRVFDQEGDEPYLITGTADRRFYTLKVKRDGEHIGTIRKELLALRVPLVHERNPVNLTITTKDGAEFKIRTKLVPNGRRFDVEPCGWRIQSPTKLISDFTAKRGEETIFRVSKRPGYDVPTYILDFENKGYGSLALLVTLGIIYDDFYRG